MLSRPSLLVLCQNFYAVVGAFLVADVWGLQAEPRGRLSKRGSDSVLAAVHCSSKPGSGESGPASTFVPSAASAPTCVAAIHVGGYPCGCSSAR